MSVSGFDFPLGIWATKVITPCSSITDLCPPERTSLLPSTIFQLDQTVVVLLALGNRVFITQKRNVLFLSDKEHFTLTLTLSDRLLHLLSFISRYISYFSVTLLILFAVMINASHLPATD